MMKSMCLGLAIAVTAASVGCVGFRPDQEIVRTETVLSEKNFRVVKTSVRGASSGFSLFMGLIPIIPASYTDAMTALHEAAEIDGKSAALVNLAQDSTQVNMIFFSIPTVTITADVIEFLE